jgi:alkylation response protein AidB-like acyl-CoA dehydrogenase
VDLSLSQEQRLLEQSVVRYTETAREHQLDPQSQWQHLAELGWLALLVQPEYGGLGCGAIELALVMEGIGRSNTTAPYVPTAVVGATLIALLGDEAQKQALLGQLIEGRLRLALAHSAAKGYDIDATSVEGGWCLEGVQTLVHGGGVADRFLVSARVSDAEGGLALFIVSRDEPGIVIERYQTLDGGSGADLKLAGALVPAAARLPRGDVTAAINYAIDEARLAICFDAVGAASAMLDATVTYTRARKQFGQPLAALQVVRHKLADMHVACEDARMISLHAALLADGPERERAIAMAKYRALTSARAVAEQAIQLHGAMGVTEELPVARYFRRILACEAMFGSPDAQFRRFNELRHARMAEQSR